MNTCRDYCHFCGEVTCQTVEITRTAEFWICDLCERTVEILFNDDDDWLD